MEKSLTKRFTEVGDWFKTTEVYRISAARKEETKKEKTKKPVRSYDRFTSFGRVLALTITVVFLFFVFWLALQVRASLFIIGLSFLPTFLTVISTFVLLELYLKRMFAVVLALPFLFALLFFLLYQQVTFIPSSELQNIMLLNIFISVVCVLAILAFGVHHKVVFEKRKEVTTKKQTAVVAEKVTKKEVLPLLVSLEESAKALNFAIGRVYSAKKGGSKSLRESIRIDRELYNKFSELQEENRLDKEDVVPLVKDMLLRLTLLEKQEKEVFGVAHRTLKKLERQRDGSSTILQVLKGNDKDPVDTYYHNLKQTCHQILDAFT